MPITVLAVGRLRPLWREPADEYLRRLRRFERVAEIEVREAGRAPTPEVARRQEAERLGARRPPGGRLVALERGSDGWSSETVAARLARWRETGQHVALVLGGSHGLDRGFLEECHERWSLGLLTLPHELARVVMLEQLYRGHCILAGTPYHK